MPSRRAFFETWHRASCAAVSAEHTPTRTSLSSAMKRASPCWRTISVSTHVATAAAAHADDWKATPAHASETGGSW